MKGAGSEFTVAGHQSKQQIEHFEGAVVHQLMMNHNGNIMLLCGQTQFVAQVFKRRAPACFFSGVKIDINIKIFQRIIPALFTFAPGHTAEAQLSQDFERLFRAAVPGGGEER